MNIEQHFELVSDDDFEGEHEELDKEIKEDFARLTDTNIERLGPHVLAHIVRNSKGRLLQKYTDYTHGAELLETNKTLRQEMIDGSKSGFKPVRLCSEHLSSFTNCTSDPLTVELLRPGDYLFRIVHE